MRTVRARITPLSAFGTLPLGDTLFGQVCWAIRNRQGEVRLNELLKGYTEGRPFLVVSDAMPAGYVPRPALPGHLLHPLEHADRKEVKKRQWLPVDKLSEPLADWLDCCVKSADLPGGWVFTHLQPHNSINRRTGTTGENFAPYTMPQHWYGRLRKDNGKDRFVIGQLDLYLVLDETRLSDEEVKTALSDIGDLGFGRDAGIGLGRFKMDVLEEASLPAQRHANAWMTLAPCAPQGLDWVPDRCFYQVFTRFGRHGDAAVQRGNPFKTPVLLAAAGAVLTPTRFEPRLFIGQGLGGDGSLSKAVPQTVQQGYAPVAAVSFDQSMDIA
jgi:CRISPR-associated protein Csm4